MERASSCHSYSMVLPWSLNTVIPSGDSDWPSVNCWLSWIRYGQRSSNNSVNHSTLIILMKLNGNWNQPKSELLLFVECDVRVLSDWWLNTERQCGLNKGKVKHEWLIANNRKMKNILLVVSDERNLIAPVLVNQSLSWHPNFWQLLSHLQRHDVFLSTTIVLQYFRLYLIGWLDFPCCFSGGRLKWRILSEVLWTLWKPCLLGRSRRCPLHFTSRYPTPFIFLIVFPRGSKGTVLTVQYSSFCKQVCSWLVKELDNPEFSQ